MGARTLWKTLELRGDAQDGLAWLERRRQTATELGCASQNLLDGARARWTRARWTAGFIRPRW